MIRRRLGEVSGKQVGSGAEGTTSERVFDALKKVGNRLPKSPAEMGKLQLRLVHAGLRRRDALILFLGVRAGCALACFLLVASSIFVRTSLPVALGAAGLGYVLPGVFLARMAKRRQHRIRLSVPDALDLLVVSVEAGLGLDQAMQRVADELASVHPELSDDMRLINLEMRAGKARPRRSATSRIAPASTICRRSSPVLVQTDKFGTSVAQALRVYSDVLRTKRRQRAEEAAAKTAVKMVFPLVDLHLPGDLGRDARPGRDQVHAGPRADGQKK